MRPGAAFPDIAWRAIDDQGMFQLQIQRPDFQRWFDARELSDGTLRFFCLCAALLSPNPPPLLVLNEPETSLHEHVFPALARLIGQAQDRSQILVVTHSAALAGEISSVARCKRIELIQHEGETRRSVDGTAHRVWVFDDDDEDGECV